MTEGLGALLGCVQGEVSQFELSGKSRAYQPRLTERVVLPLPPEGAHVVSLVCRHCQQDVRVHVYSRRSIRRRRMLTRLGLGGAVCAWTAAVAFLLVYFSTSFPRSPGAEVALAGVLMALGVVLWVCADGHDAFGGDVAVGCRIEPSAEERAWAKQVSAGVLRTIPHHVLMDADEEPGWLGGRRATDQEPAEGRRKPNVPSSLPRSGQLGEARPGQTSRIA